MDNESDLKEQTLDEFFRKPFKDVLENAKSVSDSGGSIPVET